jgi:hypothetical protein
MKLSLWEYMAVLSALKIRKVVSEVESAKEKLSTLISHHINPVEDFSRKTFGEDISSHSIFFHDLSAMYYTQVLMCSHYSSEMPDGLTKYCENFTRDLGLLDIPGTCGTYRVLLYATYLVCDCAIINALNEGMGLNFIGDHEKQPAYKVTKYVYDRYEMLIESGGIEVVPCVKRYESVLLQNTKKPDEKT